MAGPTRRAPQKPKPGTRPKRIDVGSEQRAALAKRLLQSGWRGKGGDGGEFLHPPGTEGTTTRRPVGWKYRNGPTMNIKMTKTSSDRNKTKAANSATSKARASMSAGAAAGPVGLAARIAAAQLAKAAPAAAKGVSPWVAKAKAGTLPPKVLSSGAASASGASTKKKTIKPGRRVGRNPSPGTPRKVGPRSR